MRKSFWLAIVILLVVFTAVAGYTMQRTSTTEFCLSCHEMERHSFELKRSSHAVDKDKKPIECRQCHLPPSFGLGYMAVKSYLGVRDLLLHSLIDTRDLDRRAMQGLARRFVQDENCLACHQDLTRNVKGEPLGLEGQKAHQAWLGKDGVGRRTCASCHNNMAHLPVFDRRYDCNRNFAAKLPLTGE